MYSSNIATIKEVIQNVSINVLWAAYTAVCLRSSPQNVLSPKNVQRIVRRATSDEEREATTLCAGYGILKLLIFVLQ